MADARNLYRRLRVSAKQLLGSEPTIAREVDLPLEFHGDPQAGWYIPADSLRPESVVVDVGTGENISFSTSIIDRYGCQVHGFDPTPRAIAYAQGIGKSGFILHEKGLAASNGRAVFYLPNDQRHVSGSLDREDHVGGSTIDVELGDIDSLFSEIGATHIDLLKMDIEGAEYGVIDSESFRRMASSIGMICIEFHHRWRSHGVGKTLKAVKQLRDAGFRCAWGSPTSNEEFLFVGRSFWAP